MWQCNSQICIVGQITKDDETAGLSNVHICALALINLPDKLCPWSFNDKLFTPQNTMYHSEGEEVLHERVCIGRF